MQVKKSSFKGKKKYVDNSFYFKLDQYGLVLNSHNEYDIWLILEDY